MNATRFLPLAFALTCTVVADAAPLPAGEDLLGADYVGSLRPVAGDRARAEIIPVQGDGFNRAVRVTNLQRMAQFYEFQLARDIPVAVKRDDILLVTFHARGEAPKNESGEADCVIYFQKNSPNWDKDLSEHFSVGTEWKRFDYPFRATRDFPAAGSALCFGTGFGEQTIEIGGVTLLRIPAGTPIQDLPRTPLSYRGEAPDAPWRAPAAARIEKYRKGDLTVKVVDRDGNPVPGAAVSAAMTRHAFGFSSVIKASLISEDSDTARIYREKVLELFNASGTENALKWPPWDGEWGTGAFSRDTTLAALRWLKEHDFHVRGHVMVWPGLNNLPEKVRKALEDPARADAVPEMVREHIVDIAKATNPYLDEWDVINETRTNHDLMDRFGRDIMVDWFRYAAEAAPGKKLYINDFSILNGNGPGSPVHETYKETIRFLLDKGAPVTGIGLQSHIGSRMNDPALVVRILDDFAAFGLDMRITEFDINVGDEDAQARYTRDFMTACFSHPKVAGFQMWGFWEGAHWKPAGAMYRRDWEEKPNAKAYKDLVFREWWTDEEGTASQEGTFTTRGFLGTYAVRAALGEREAKGEARLTPDGTVVTLILP